MTDISQIIKTALFELKKKAKPITPDNYFSEFYKQIKLAELKSEECELFDEILKKSNLENDLSINNYSSLALKLFEKNEEQLKKFSGELSTILAPSIDFDIEDDIEELLEELSKEPVKVIDRSTVTKLKEITNKRIKNDRDVLKQKTIDIVKLTSLVSKQFENSIISSDDSCEELSHIKEELEKLDISESSQREISVMQTKLVDTVANLESVIDNHKLALIEEQKNFCDLEKRFTELQKSLQSAEEEKFTDYLTKVLNRRAFDTEIEKIEKKHKVFGSHYAIVFYDIDHFKSINDNYGHDCGDAVLRTFAAVLKNLTRQEDIVARYGGEEFVVILNYTNHKEINKYINRVRDLVKTSDFIYKGEKLEVKFSAGIGFREYHQTPMETIHKADELLYEAKHSGRDKVIMDNGTVI